MPTTILSSQQLQAANAALNLTIAMLNEINGDSRHGPDHLLRHFKNHILETATQENPLDTIIVLTNRLSSLMLIPDYDKGTHFTVLGLVIASYGLIASIEQYHIEHKMPSFIREVES